jgi:hypothetical protein
MYEVFPLLAGVVIALFVPRFFAQRQRKIAYGALGVLVAALATIVAGEEWFFIFIDLAEVVVAIAVTQAIVARWPSRRTTPLS